MLYRVEREDGEMIDKGYRTEALARNAILTDSPANPEAIYAIYDPEGGIVSSQRWSEYLVDARAHGVNDRRVVDIIKRGGQ